MLSLSIYDMSLLYSIEYSDVKLQVKRETDILDLSNDEPGLLALRLDLSIAHRS
jgi:hypothetical protein